MQSENFEFERYFKDALIGSPKDGFSSVGDEYTFMMKG